MLGRLKDTCGTCRGEVRFLRSEDGAIVSQPVECATCGSTGQVPHACTVCGTAHPPREDFDVLRAPICCEGCTCGLHAGNEPKGCENCTDLGLCFAAAEKSQAECPRELELREGEIAAGYWDLPTPLDDEAAPP